MQIVIQIHRYLGIGLGLLVLLWCLSGFVLMYVQYPAQSRAEALDNLDPLNLASCCRLPAHWPDDLALVSAEVEMLLGRPLLRVRPHGGGVWTAFLDDGRELGQVTPQMAEAIVAPLAEGDFTMRELVNRDQWTVQGSYAVHRPLHRLETADGHSWYVSSVSGEVVLETERSERFWNWIGAVVHWLYPTMLRKNVELWSLVVIWASAVGVFLTVTGLYLGAVRFRWGTRASPYQGWHSWHHWTGLIFGALTLTWVASGLLSMNPLGALESRGFAAEAERLGGRPLTLAWVRRSLHQQNPAFADTTVRLEAHTFAGVESWTAWSAEEEAKRLNGPLSEPRLAAQAQALRPGVAMRESGLLEMADAYYYAHHEPRPFPVYRAVFADGERYYLDRRTGVLLLAVDRERRWYRWLFQGLHRFDFLAWLRTRPVWDLVMWLLLAGVTASTLTGVYLGLRRVVR